MALTARAEQATRSRFLDTLAELLSEWGAGEAGELRPIFGESLAEFTDAQIAGFAGRLETTGSDWGYHPPDPVATRLSRVVHRRVAAPGAELYDQGGLAVARERPVIFLGNHLSFIDANAVDFLLHREGHGDIAARLTVLMGPKVFSLPLRRLASLCFGAIKLPQSPSRASGEAVLSKRETLRLAYRALETARERRERGEHLLIFSEGSRSRTGSMQRALPAVARYIENPWATVVPFGVWGTEKMLPLGEDHAYVYPVCVRIGRAFEARRLFERPHLSRTVISDAIGYLTADLLPREYRGFYSGTPSELAEARALASSLA
ncbi:MAG: 1-acyl-sn-glycerol-3-phosphate acyltransferase [Proteobacteria bacterium]|nr:1-acyl-sn-glycerol-3-phosphate acyltransferase [Pseudomonadota bacterium]